MHNFNKDIIDVGLIESDNQVIRGIFLYNDQEIFFNSKIDKNILKFPLTPPRYYLIFYTISLIFLF